MRYDILPFSPNVTISESIKYQSDVRTSYNGLQTRSSLQNIPERIVSYTYELHDGQELGIFESVLHKYLGVEHYVPLYHEYIKPTSASGSTIVCDTRYLSFATDGHLTILNDFDDFEIMTIDSFDSTSITTTEAMTGTYDTASFVLPTYKGFIEPPISENQYTSELSEYSLNYHLTDNVPQTSISNIVINPDHTYKTHNGVEVFQEFMGKETALNHSITKPITIYYNGYGKYSQANNLSFNNKIFNYRLNLNTRQEIWNFKNWLQVRLGRTNDFYTPMYKKELVPTQTIGSSDTTINIKNIGYVNNYDQHIRKVDILIATTGGTWYTRTITNSTSISSDVEQLTISSALGSEVTLENLAMMCFLDRRTLAADTIRMTWNNNYQAVADIISQGVVR